MVSQHTELVPAFLRGLPRLQAIGLTGAGAGLIDLQAMTEAGIRVTHAPLDDAALLARSLFRMIERTLNEQARERDESDPTPQDQGSRYRAPGEAVASPHPPGRAPNKTALRLALVGSDDITAALRALAREAGLPNADKKDSQGICFIGQVRMQDFLRAYVPDRPGPIVRADDGRRLGTHPGLHYYTLGQRRGIRIPSNTEGKAYVVVGKRPEDHALLVAFDEPEAPGLFTDRARVRDLHWLVPAPTGPLALEGRVRYRDPRVRLQLVPEPGDRGEVRFDQPQRGLARGQILALYQGQRLVGGGIYA